MELYEATIKDLQGVSKLFDKYRVFYEQESDLAGATNFVKQRFENKDSVILVAKDSEKYVGFTQLYPSFSSVSMQRKWILNDLYVDTAYRKQGIGEMLLRKAKEYAIATDAKGICLETAVNNDSAQRLYEKNGYVKDSAFYYYDLNL